MEALEIGCIELMERVEMEDDETRKDSLLVEYLKTVESSDEWFSFPGNPKEFSQDFSWINCEQPLSSDVLSGKLVLMDFFSYCCINCIHVMPFLHNIEEKYTVTDGLVVLGVHSAKFPNEKLETNIANAIQRYNIRHPVVNDSELKLWEELSVKCWPTMIILSPDGKVLISVPGESHIPFIETFIRTALQFYQEQAKLSCSPLHIRIGLFSSKSINENLRFPGKIAIDETGMRLVISDTGHHRVLMGSTGGDIEYVIGGKEPGCVDGSFDKARFRSPQGVAWHGPNTIFIADCDNHMIRKIDLSVKKVVTVAGIGRQGNDLEGGNSGLDQPISSPWGLVVGGSPHFSDSNSILYIAMSGCHQIWALFLKNADYQKGAELELGTCIRYAGSGSEENRNNSYPHKAGFAQPSGLTLDRRSHSMYVADSESSTIRRVNLTSGAVQPVVGGAVDPTNLFAYGDVDGEAREAKLQHPLGVAWDYKRSLLYVADTYNHKIKIVDPMQKTCRTMDVVTDNAMPSVFNEPSGLCIDPLCEHLYIADTNNHDIKVLSLGDSTFKSLRLKFPKLDPLENLSLDEAGEPVVKPAKLITGKNLKPTVLDRIIISQEGNISIEISSKNFKLNQEAPSAWQIGCSSASTENETLGNEISEYHLVYSGKFSGSGIVCNLLKASEILSKGELLKSCQKDSFFINIYIESILYYCIENGDVCKMHRHKVILPVEIAKTKDVEDTAEVKIEIM